MRIPVVLAACLLLCACPPDGQGGATKKSNEPVKICTSQGQSCVFAEGKLGLCVESTQPCEGKACLVCQSQH
jgi:hypothetical protein